MNKSAIFISILIFGIVGALIFGVVYSYVSEPEWSEINNTTVGTVYKISPGGRGGAWFRYKVNNKIYEEFSGLDPLGLTYGEKYTLKFLKENPEQFKAIDYLPLFEKGEDTMQVDAIITRIYRFKWVGSTPHFGIEFEYVIENNVFERSQTLPPNYIELYPGLSENQVYKATAWKRDYRRAIIELDRRIK